MALNQKGGTFNSPTSTGNVATTGVGFTPKLLILYSTLATDAAAGSPTVGFGTSSSARWSMSCTMVKGASDAIGNRIFDSSKIFRFNTGNIGGTLTTFIAADLVSLDSDGFTLNWTTVQASGFPINYFCIGGTDFSVKVGTYDSNASTGNQAITGVGFAPKAIMNGICDIPSLDGTGFTDAHWCFGAGISSSTRSSVSLANTNIAASNTIDAGGFTTTSLWTLNTSLRVVFGQADLVSLDSDGFTVNITTVTSATALRIGYVALGGTAQYNQGTITQPGSTGNLAITGIGFQPSAELFWGGGKSADNTLTPNSRAMFGASVSSSDRGVLWSSEKDNSTQPADSRLINRTSSLIVVTDNTTIIRDDADFVSQDIDGFTQNWTAVGGTAILFGYLAIGAAAVTPTSRHFLPLLGAG